MHGKQYLSPQFRRQADELLHDDVRHRPRCSKRCIRARSRCKVGVIGLGTGTLASYGTHGRPVPLLRHQSRGRPASPARTSPISHDSEAHDRDAARRRATDARARAAADLRRAGDRRVLERCDSGAPHHRRKRSRSTRKHMKPDRRDRVPRHQPLSRPRSRRRRARRRARPAAPSGSTTKARTSLASRSDWVLVSNDRALLARPQIADAATPIVRRARLAPVDRRLQQPVPGAAQVTPTIGGGLESHRHAMFASQTSADP